MPFVKRGTSCDVLESTLRGDGSLGSKTYVMADFLVVYVAENGEIVIREGESDTFTDFCQSFRLVSVQYFENEAWVALGHEAGMDRF